MIASCGGKSGQSANSSTTPQPTTAATPKPTFESKVNLTALGLAIDDMQTGTVRLLHDLVCDGKMTLSAVRKGIASDWQAVYRKVYGVPPTGG